MEGDIEDFQKAGIKPVFVFSGLKIVRNEKPFSVNDDGPAKRSQAWDLYDQGLASEAVEAFGAAGRRTRAPLMFCFAKYLWISRNSATT